MNRDIFKEKLKSFKLNQNLNILYFVNIIISFAFFVFSKFLIIYLILFLIIDFALLIFYKFIKFNLIKKEFLLNGICLSFVSLKFLILSFLLLKQINLLNLISILIYLLIYLFSYFVFYKIILKEKTKTNRKNRFAYSSLFCGVVAVIIYRFVDNNFSYIGINILMSFVSLFLSCISNFAIWFYIYYYWIKKFKINIKEILENQN